MAFRSLDDLPDLSTRPELAEFSSVSIPTLDRWGAAGIGPKITRLGRSVRYRKADVIDWLNSLDEMASA